MTGNYIRINNGLNIISLHCADSIEYLQINKPLSVKWFAGHGTILEYFVNLPPEYKIDDSYINSLKEDYTNKEDLLFVDLHPLLSILEDGIYEVNFHSGDLPPFFQFLKDKNGNPYWSLDMCSQYTSGRNFINLKKDAEIKIDETTNLIYEPILLGTQPMNKVNKDRVNHYKKIISKGDRPFAIIIGSSNKHFEAFSPSYIIDGHHKLLAYKELKIFPHLVEIIKQGYPNEFIDTEYLLNNMHSYQINNILKNCDNKELLFKESIANKKSIIHSFL